MFEFVFLYVCYGGEQCFYCYDLVVIGLLMKFLVYLLLQVVYGCVLVLFYFVGFMSIDEMFVIKVGVQ